MRKYLLASAGFHALLAGLLWFGLPDFGQPLPEEGGVTVELVTEVRDEPPRPPAAAQAPIPERKAASRQAQPTPEQPREVPKAPSPPPPPPPPPAPSPEPPPPSPPPPAPPPPPPAPVPQPKPAPEPKPAPPAPPPPTPPPPTPTPPPPQTKPVPAKAKPEPAKVAPKPEPEDEFDALLKSVENIDRRVTAPEKRDGSGQVASNEAARAGQTGPQTSRLSALGLSKLVSDQITPCWNKPPGAESLIGWVVPINIQLAPDGSVQDARATDLARLADPLYRAVAESAVRATRLCSPLDLPSEGYGDWRNIIMNFYPDRM